MGSNQLFERYEIRVVVKNGVYCAEQESYLKTKTNLVKELFFHLVVRHKPRLKFIL